MAGNSRTFVRLMVACAALLAQVVPLSFCEACQRDGCPAANHDRVPIGTSGLVASTHGCPLCDAASQHCRPDSPEHPCRCQFNPRQDQPLTANPSPPPPDAFNQVAVLETASLHAPHPLGQSREYAAASLAIPIRPARILFGVWRN